MFKTFHSNLNGIPSIYNSLDFCSFNGSFCTELIIISSILSCWVSQTRRWTNSILLAASISFIGLSALKICIWSINWIIFSGLSFPLINIKSIFSLCKAFLGIGNIWIESLSAIIIGFLNGSTSIDNESKYSISNGSLSFFGISNDTPSSIIFSGFGAFNISNSSIYSISLSGLGFLNNSIWSIDCTSFSGFGALNISNPSIDCSSFSGLVFPEIYISSIFSFCVVHSRGVPSNSM